MPIRLLLFGKLVILWQKILENTMSYPVDSDAVRDDAVATLSRYIQFNTTNPPGDEMQAAQWFRDQLIQRSITRDVTVHEPVPNRGLVLARIPGSEPLKPLLINHHIDVVAADPTQWTHAPFSGDIADGFVWGRGTLDTKQLGILHLFALESLAKEGVQFRRPIIVTAVPDEETGGVHGMQWLIDNYLASIDPEWVWDEGSGGFKGLFGPQIMFGVLVAEKQIHQMRLIAHGEPGHGSMPHDKNANIILNNALHRIANSPRPLRVNPMMKIMLQSIAASQKFPTSFILNNLQNPLVTQLAGKRLTQDRLFNALLRDTVSINVVKGGYKTNVIPETAQAELDCRLLPDTDGAEFENWLRERVADERVTVEPMGKSTPSGIAPLDNKFYQTITHVVDKHVPGASVFPLQMPGATDGRYFRQRGYAAYGFGPMILEKQDINRTHGIDERISIDNIMLGIKMTRDIIRELCVD
jgi:acetylornithine deacetylase/succinyl-diaminopimelate desuccinylase-like protein